MINKKNIDVAKTDPNYNYLLGTNLTRFENEWVAISGRKVVAHGKYSDVVYKKARQIRPRAEISLTKILPQKPMILTFF